MHDPFSSLELQLIKSALMTKSDQEIADLLERPVEEVIEIINQLTDGNASQRTSDVNQFKLEQEEKKQRKKKAIVRKVVTPSVLDDHKVARAKNREAQVGNAAEIRQAEKRRWDDRQKIKTREVDYSTMVSIKVADKTWIQVPKGTDHNVAIALYQANIKIRERGLQKTENE